MGKPVRLQIGGTAGNSPNPFVVASDIVTSPSYAFGIYEYIYAAYKLSSHKNLPAWTITNAHTIGVTGGTGIYLKNGGTITNDISAEISGAAVGIVITAYSFGIGYQGVVDNDGFIGSGLGSSGFGIELSSGHISNGSNGTIAGGSAIFIGPGGGTVENNGTVQGGAVGITLYVAGTVTNNGTITSSYTQNAYGVVLGGGGELTNNEGALIRAAYVAVKESGSGSGFVDNYKGTIAGDHSAIYLTNGGKVVNQYGTIAGEINSRAPTTRCAIRARSPIPAPAASPLPCPPARSTTTPAAASSAASSRAIPAPW